VSKTVLKNVVLFIIPTIGVPTVIAHGININGTPVVPELVLADRPGFNIAVDATNITVIREANAPGAGLNVYVEHFHTIEAVFPPGGIAQFLGEGTGASSLPLMLVSNLLTSATNPNLVPAGQIVQVNTGAAVTVTLPLAGPSAGMTVIVKDATGTAAANNITVAASGGQLIDGAATSVINTNRGARIFVSNGSGWLVASST